MKKADIIRSVLGERFHQFPQHQSAQVYAPSNIALCKYWGKRNQELNLPVTASLSVSLGDKGAATEIKTSDQAHDTVILNNQSLDLFSPFCKRLLEFLNLFRRAANPHFHINITSNIPIAAGMASSAAGFASIIKALDALYGWKLSEEKLSVLARLGSGSACRSIWQGFVEWHVGVRDDGMDSHGQVIDHVWPDLCIGLVVVSESDKGLSSREAMQRTVTTSPLYSAWPAKVNSDLSLLKRAIAAQDFPCFGQVAEANAMAMHATMLSAWPPVMYYLPETIAAMKRVWQLRSEGVELYLTQDAGPNLKLLFLKKDREKVRGCFSGVHVIDLF